ncbi:hypothetical protein LR48_Vigan02g216800 [Vigna angularis]|uniref:Uncharacterized protein n=1 Tax=Phaseolus angularis TaxID=3914 RepID=A0A0L9TZK9_PHAAN|nr:hypothetical protein LR48_Vigan02g216800 [Vigna angularis]
MPLLPNSSAERNLLVYQSNATQNQPSQPPGSPQDHPLADDPVPAAELAPLRSLRKPPKKYGFTSPLSLTTTLSSVSIPSSYKQAMEHECWQKVIEAELLALEENQTWDVVPSHVPHLLNLQQQVCVFN